MNDPIAWAAPAVATGVGSMPGTDPEEATNIITGEFASFPHLVELPARGPGADPVGRTASVLAEVDRSFDVETSPSGWRLGHAGQSDMRRARSWFAQDIDALEQHAVDFTGHLKAAMLGPWTLVSRVADPAGEAMLRDHGAVGDLAAALAEAAVLILSRIRRAVPAATIVLELDEPSIPDVLDGRVRMTSGRLFHRSVEPPVVQQHLTTVLSAIEEAGAVPAVRCARKRPPLDLLRGAGARTIAVDITRELPLNDALPRAWEAGVGLLLGCVPVKPGIERLSDTAVSEPLRRFMDECGFGEVPSNVAITPTSGLAALDSVSARAVISACTRVGAIVRDEHPEVVDV